MKSKRAKALEIPKKVKLIVWERDNHQCIFCHRLGIPENIFCACLLCNNKFNLICIVIGIIIYFLYRWYKKSGIKPYYGNN